MAINIELDGETYEIPTTGNTGWGAALTAYLRALADAVNDVALPPSVLQMGMDHMQDEELGTYFLRPGMGSDAESPMTEVFLVVPFAGTISNLRIVATTGPDVEEVYVVRKNGVNTALTATIFGLGTSASDLTHSFTVAAGDRISISEMPASGIHQGSTWVCATMKLAAS